MEKEIKKSLKINIFALKDLGEFIDKLEVVVNSLRMLVDNAKIKRDILEEDTGFKIRNSIDQ